MSSKCETLFDELSWAPSNDNLSISIYLSTTFSVGVHPCGEFYYNPDGFNWIAIILFHDRSQQHTNFSWLINVIRKSEITIYKKLITCPRLSSLIPRRPPQYDGDEKTTIIGGGALSLLLKREMLECAG